MMRKTEGVAQRQLLAIDQKEADRQRVPGPPRESGTTSKERESALQKLDEEQRVLPKYEAKVEEATDEIALLDGRIKDLEAKKVV
ncbi:hypothetical protein Pst134EA_011123 [Puccinia striiformis f. sp. tritici]|uniref:hypothetical protein n=1 Tax=Puccinia striiformis f. sp. tritici TaxID=168172 RepID=UPI002008E947|nr:hypothetical protein Pst134EA_011123 [Puccinia striiformis f. sp. tritici]KAH9467480.1 hypothetical protein Pst134EA_011123 [Puccinia striiformis f. sp. tritici]